MDEINEGRIFMTVKEKILENLIKEEAFKFRQKLIEENEVRLMNFT